MEIDKVQLLILSILEDMGATTPGTGMTLREIGMEVNKSDDNQFVQKTINRKVINLKERGCVNSKMKMNKAKLYYITAKGKELKGVLFTEDEK